MHVAVVPSLYILWGTVGPDLVAFLKQRRTGEVKRAVEKEAAMDEGEPLDGGELKGTSRHTLPSEVKDLEGSWLHMDVTEAEKLEWMTDAPVTSQDDVGGAFLLLASGYVTSLLSYCSREGERLDFRLMVYSCQRVLNCLVHLASITMATALQ